MAVWYALVYFLGRGGFFGQKIFFVPMIFPFFIALFFWLKFLYVHPGLKRIFENIPLPWIFAVQIFRVMGYGFILFYRLGLIPGEFALPTGYGDVLVGTLAPLVAFLYWKGRAKRLAVWWNLLGIGDLALALTLGISTYPSPLKILPTAVDNGPIALLPLVMVPLFAVPISLLLHFMSLRRLRELVS